MVYIAVPFIAWFVAGCLKFVINYLRFGSKAKAKIGNGGFPSNHTTIMVSTIMLIGFKEGFETPVFGLGAAVSFIVIIDALGLRRHVGYHAKSLNELIHQFPSLSIGKSHRESMGHNRVEVLGGILLGILLGFILSQTM